MDSLGFELPELKSPPYLKSILQPFNQLLTDGILWLSYGIALLSILKFFIFLVNGFQNNPLQSTMGTGIMETPSYLRGEHWDHSLSSERKTTLDRAIK